MSLRGAAAIIGIGELPTRRAYPGRSMLGLMAEGVRQAIQDAHLRKDDIDGLVVEGGPVFPAVAAEYMGFRTKYAVAVGTMGASGASGVASAALAVANGLANYVVVAISAEREPGQAWGNPPQPGWRTEFEVPYGPAVAANTGYALMYSRHMYEYGTRPEQMARLAVNQRFNALPNPNSVFQGQPITVEDVLKSRYVNWPLHLLECVMPCAGAEVVIVTSAERARSRPQRPVYILGEGLAADSLAMFLHERITETPVVRSAPLAYEMAGYGPRDIQFAEFYD